MYVIEYELRGRCRPLKTVNTMAEVTSYLTELVDAGVSLLGIAVTDMSGSSVTGPTARRLA